MEAGLKICPGCGSTMTPSGNCVRCNYTENMKPRERCEECKRILTDEDIWFTGDESPTGKTICGECFDKLPCEGCRGL